VRARAGPARAAPKALDSRFLVAVEPDVVRLPRDPEVATRRRDVARHLLCVADDRQTPEPPHEPARAPSPVPPSIRSPDVCTMSVSFRGGSGEKSWSQRESSGTPRSPSCPPAEGRRASAGEAPPGLTPRGFLAIARDRPTDHITRGRGAPRSPSPRPRPFPRTPSLRTGREPRYSGGRS
jgi:hypothetical protein